MLQRIKPIHIKWGLAAFAILLLGFLLPHVRDVLWIIGQDEPPTVWREWALFIAALCSALLGAGAVVAGIWRWVAKPMIARGQAWFELQWEEQRIARDDAKADRERLERTMKTVETQLAPDGNGGDSKLPPELRNLPIRALIIGVHDELRRHLDVSEPLIEVFKEEHKGS